VVIHAIFFILPEPNKIHYDSYKIEIRLDLPFRAKDLTMGRILDLDMLTISNSYYYDLNLAYGAVIAIRGCRNVQPQLSLVSSISRCLQEPEFLQRHTEKRVYFTEVEEAGLLYFSGWIGRGHLDALRKYE